MTAETATGPKRDIERVAVYAGTFDPITCGHVSVIERSARLFDRLVVVVAVNPNKQPFFSLQERVDMICDVVAPWPNVECEGTTDYVIQLARKRQARYLVRGVRSSVDVEGEIALADVNRELAPEIETVFIPAHPELSEVSSSRLKELARARADISRYCPAQIVACLKQRLAVLVPERTVTHV